MLSIIKGDIFTAPDNYSICHCISADFKLGAGIAYEIDKRFGTRDDLFRLFPDYYNIFKANNYDSSCILAGRIINLVTKEKYYHKPSYNSLYKSLLLMKDLCIRNNIYHIAMPEIGCGLDGLKWDKVYPMIDKLFGKDVEFHIIIYSL